MIHLNEAPDAPEWSAQAKTCRRCAAQWHAGDCEPLDLPAGVTLGDN